MNAPAGLPVAVWQAVALLTASNVFMTSAWYAHLKAFNHRPWYLAALCMLGAVYFVFRD